MIALRRWLAALLVVAGSGAVIWAGVTVMTAASYDRQVRSALDQMAVAPGEKRELPSALLIGDPIGTLEVARIGLSGVVVEGDTDAVLDRAIGHLPDTPLPWQRGNSALAAHRDRIFRPLRGVRMGDILRLKTPHGQLEYLVKETVIVKPQDLWVLDPTPTSTLTLVSCYPFNFVGNAPERFVVRAERIPAGIQIARTSLFTK